MRNNDLRFFIALAASVAIAGSILTLVFSRFVGFIPAPMARPSAQGSVEPVVLYDPPRIEDAPQDFRSAVKLGYAIMMDTRHYARQYVGNDLDCKSCHFQGGITHGGRDGGLSLVGVAAKYPIYRERQHYSADLVIRTNGCFERSMNGHPPPPDNREMQAIMAYYQWISKGIPIYAQVPWLGLKDLRSNHQPNAASGERIYAGVCAQCHGADGEGTLIAPPLWGPRSFNDGAGMSKETTMSAFSYLNMPKGNPNLSVDQALDVAAYATRQPRPHFAAADKW